jgi:two-component system, sensor histidine kinase and response regulator
MAQIKRDMNAPVELLHKLENSESELREKRELFELITLDLVEQLETLTGFFHIMYNHATTLTSAEIKEFASRMDVSVKNLLLLAINTTEWEKIRNNKISLKVEKIDLKPAIIENIHFYHHQAIKKNITAISIVDKGIAINADREKFDFIMRNLISNGIKFTHEGGNLDISAKDAGDFIEIIVEDDGIGIPEKILSKIFDEDEITGLTGNPGERTTGYGLITVKHLVELQGGRIQISSEFKKGTVVSVFLPRAEFDD